MLGLGHQAQTLFGSNDIVVACMGIRSQPDDSQKDV